MDSHFMALQNILENRQKFPLYGFPLYGLLLYTNYSITTALYIITTLLLLLYIITN